MKPKRVEDIMSTALVILYEDQTLDVADMEMETGRVRHLPVVERGKPERLAGLVTHRDLLRHAGRAFFEREKSREQMLRQVVVSTIMRRKAETAKTTDIAADAARRMLEKKLGCLPVVNESGALVGIITEADFVQFALAYLEGR